MNAYTNAVDTSDLTRTFGNFTAVDKVNFYIPKRGNFWVIRSERCRQNHNHSNAVRHHSSQSWECDGTWI